MYMMLMYYSIVHTHHIHCSDMYIHVYARWVGFQMHAAAPGHGGAAGEHGNQDPVHGRSGPVLPVTSGYRVDLMACNGPDFYGPGR
jgi:hypothetical protein